MSSALVADVLSVGYNRGQRDIQTFGDFLVDESANDQCQHLGFARRQFGLCRGALARNGVCAVLPVSVLEQGEDGLQQVVFQL